MDFSGSLIVSCAKKPQPADDTRFVKVFVAGNGVGQTRSTFHGVIHAEFEPNLSFRVNGKIIKRNVDIGQQVVSGQVLASLDPTDYKLSADSANAQLASAKSNYITQKQIWNGISNYWRRILFLKHNTIPKKSSVR